MIAKIPTEKDVARTDRLLDFYQDSARVQQLRDALMTYCMYDFDIGVFSYASHM